ncbi:unnamed protein product [Lactuca virosa]|uniref:Alpha-D-phosphohexomutase alpha/beta/alpha domain-containing protein n=1 Tax=Lactuca virosa TaxID=75947 RepID=A0AAU9LH83_9ASTR|nr:unnamed protein product [Lactuca virosa]
MFDCNNKPSNRICGSPLSGEDLIPPMPSFPIAPPTATNYTNIVTYDSNLHSSHLCIDYQEPYYLHNFVQSTFNAFSTEKIKGSTLVVSGDGRYYSKDAIQIIIKMTAANGARRIWVGQNGLLSTPAVSAVVRERVGVDGFKANGAFILTASHNPGRPIISELAKVVITAYVDVKCESVTG